MDFDSFLTHINSLKKQSLGGQISQFKLAPKLRIQYPDSEISDRSPNDAAVMAVFYPNAKGETQFLLMLRATYNGTHSSQISFPGGKLDKIDLSLLDAALRETEEEMGIKRTDIQFIRPLTKTYIPPSNFWVHPFIGYLKKPPQLIPNEEVEEVIEVELETLLKEDSLITKKMSTSYMNNIDVPCFELNGHIVWGATAMILSEIKDLVKSIF